MKIIYRKNIPLKFQKKLINSAGNKISKIFNQCNNCKFAILCNAEISKEYFNLKNKKHKGTYYFKLTDEHEKCLLKGDKINGDKHN